MRVVTNFKNLGGESIDIGDRVVITGNNESGKSALAMAILLPLTKVAQQEIFRAQASGRALSAMAPGGVDTITSEIYSGTPEALDASWSLKGKGNATLNGPRAGKLVNVWTTINDMLAGNAPKMAEILLASPGVTSKDAQHALKHYKAAKAEYAKQKKANPGDVPALPPDPSEELLRCFNDLENAARRQAASHDHRKAVIDVSIRAHRYKRGTELVHAISAWKVAFSEAETLLEQATKSLLEAAVDPIAALCDKASEWLEDGETLDFDLRTNELWLCRDGVAHRALSGTGTVRVVAALGAAMYGAKGVLVVPDVGWAPDTLRSFLGTAGRCPLGQVVLTLPAVSKTAKLPHPWVLARLEG